MQKKASESQKENETLRQQLAQAQSGQDAAGNSKSSLQKTLTESASRITALLRQVDELTATRRDLLLAQSANQQALLTSKKETERLQGENAALITAQKDDAQQKQKQQQLIQQSEQSRQALEQQLAKLQAALDASQQQLAANSKQLAENNKKLAGVTESQAAKEKALSEATVLLKTRDETIKGLQQNAQQAAKNSETVKAELQEAQKKLDAQSRQLADLQKAPMPVASGEMPKTKDEIRDYALGVYWAHEIANMIKSKESLGYRIGQQQVLNGVTDLIHNQLKIPQQELLETLKELDQQSQDKEKNAATAAKTEGKAFMTRFSKTAGVKRDPMGYYYMIVNKGETKIKGSDTVALTMRESLVNGKVINDMAEKGTVLTLPLDRFPPLFKSAISKVNNLGELRIVVPPELAYGEAGNMPDIPPDSTMIYDIKIVGMKKNAQK